MICLTVIFHTRRCLEQMQAGWVEQEDYGSVPTSGAFFFTIRFEKLHSSYTVPWHGKLICHVKFKKENMSSSNAIPSVSHLYFLGLSAVGYDWLWGRIVRGPGMKAIIDTRTTGLFHDGTLLTQNYTGLRALDALFVPAVIFYNDLLSSNDPVHRMLLIDIFSTMQTTSHCISVVGWERGNSSLMAVM